MYLGPRRRAKGGRVIDALDCEHLEVSQQGRDTAKHWPVLETGQTVSSDVSI